MGGVGGGGGFKGVAMNHSRGGLLLFVPRYVHICLRDIKSFIESRSRQLHTCAMLHVSEFNNYL